MAQVSVATKRWAAVFGIVGVATVVGWIAFADMSKSLVYYLTADELLSRDKAARGATVRLGGLVQHHSITFEPKSLALRFTLGNQAEGGQSIAVQAHGAPPQMFSEGTGAVVEGIYDGEVFHAERVMVKHSNEYRPPAPGEQPRNVYTTLRPPE